MIRLGAMAMLIWLSAVVCVLAQFLPASEVEISSTKFTDEQFLHGEAASAEPVNLRSTLKLLDAPDAHPIVILLHGSDGYDSSAVNGWRSRLSDMGYATLRIDSFGRRGVSQISTDLSAVSQFAQIYDAYRAVELLATDPRVDAERVVLMGFSRGGTAVLYAGLKRFHDLYGPKAGRIVGYVPFYPACNFELVGGLEPVAAPIREFHGGADDWTSSAVCKDYVGRLKGLGADVDMTVYDGARHAFDASLAKAPFTNDTAQRSFDCMRVELNGVLLNRDTGEPFSYSDECVTTGPTVQFDPVASDEATAAVADLLQQWLGNP